MHQRLVFLLFYFIFLKSRYVHCSTDETKLDGANGIHVVDAVIQILKDKCIISDHMFLRRIAEIATNNGLDLQNSTSNSGGIWKVRRHLLLCILFTRIWYKLNINIVMP